MITRRKFTSWVLMALPGAALPGFIVEVTARPTPTVGEAIRSGLITEAEAVAYLDRTAKEQRV